MNTLVKILIGAAAVGAVAATTYVVVKKVEEKKHAADTDSDDIPEEGKEVKKDTFKDKVNKKMVRIFTWILLNKDKIEAAAAVIGFFTGILNLVNKARDYATGSKMKKTMDDFNKVMNDYTDAFNSNMQTFESDLDKVFDYMNEHDDILFKTMQKGA